MGAKEIRDQLDAEIQEMERALYGTPPNSPSEPAESDAADQTAQGSKVETEEAPPAATGPGFNVQSEKTFDAVEDDDDDDQGEPTAQKRVSWKNRFIKLKQYHDSEIYKSRKLIGNLYDQLDTKDAEIKRLSSLVEDLTKAQPKSIKDYATQEEIDAIGEEELSVMQRLAAQIAEQQTADLKAKLAASERRELEARNRAAMDAKTQAYNIFLSRLERLVPDYAEIDTDKRFEVWLQQVDPMSGFKRFDLFKQAEATGDVGRVAGFFNEFKQLVKPQRQTLDNKITPVGNSATKPTTKTTQGPEMVPMAQYEQFMADVTRGRFKGREADQRKWEAYFDKALAEGRIV